jgi:GNAT superfamily N-acetyltransferase
MPVVPGDPAAAAHLAGQAARRLLDVDPLLPERMDLPAGCGVLFTVAGPGGQLTGTAACEHWAGEPGSFDLIWGAASQYRFTPAITGPDVAGALDQLLAQWCEHLADLPGAAGQDTAATVNWPSRDVAGIGPLHRHGLTPLAVIAARPTAVHRQDVPVAGPRHAPADGTGRPGRGDQPGIRIRRAGAGDLDAVASLALEEIRFDALFGAAIERPGAQDTERRYVAGLMAGPVPWTWLAEADGAAVGVLVAERPENAGWIAPVTGLSPAAYLTQLFVMPDARGGGVGAALAREFHREAAAAGVRITLLHYAQANPLSVPFWTHQGYRPLWTSWEARPAGSLRQAS